MTIRLIKVALIAFLGLGALAYGLHNILNWPVVVDNVGQVLTLEHNVIVTVSMVPAITNETLIAIACCIIIGAEVGTGIVALIGAFILWQARNADADAFHQAKYWGAVGSLMAVILWFGGFMVVGAALFQMYQHALGDASYNMAFFCSVTAALVFLIVKDRSFE